LTLSYPFVLHVKEDVVFWNSSSNKGLLSILQFWNFSLQFISAKEYVPQYDDLSQVELHLYVTPPGVGHQTLFFSVSTSPSSSPGIPQRHCTISLVTIISQRVVVGWMWFEILSYMSCSCSGITCSLFIGSTKNVSYSNVQYSIYEMNSALSYIKLQVEWLCDLQFCVLWLISMCWFVNLL
jgi:hypothetical protein